MNHRNIKPLHVVDCHIVNHCNLNCRGCDRFAQCAETEIISVNEVETGLRRLREIMGDNVRHLNLIGGEPLLHPECIQLMNIVRKYFSRNTYCRFITNGILLPQQSDEFYITLAKTFFVLTATVYKVKVDWDVVEANCSKHGVELQYRYNRDGKEFTHTNNGCEVECFSKRLLDLNGKQEPESSYDKCSRSNRCYQLIGSKFYTCTQVGHVKHFNKYFGKNLELCKQDYLDLFEVNNAHQICEYVSKSIPFCRYCRRNELQVGIPWKVSDKSIEEYI
jgi:hypothetical protein